MRTIAGASQSNGKSNSSGSSSMGRGPGSRLLARAAPTGATKKRGRPASAREAPPPPPSPPSPSSSAFARPSALARHPGARPPPDAPAFRDPRRWVVFSDLHLSPRTLPACLDALARVRDAAAERRAGVVFLGDFWHVRGNLPVAPLNAVLRELASWPARGVPGGLVLLPGNHDQVDPRGRLHALTPLAHALGRERAFCFDEPAVWRGAVWVPYRRDPAAVRAALREACEEKGGGGVSAAMLHADVRGARVNAAWQARGGLDAEALFPPSRADPASDSGPGAGRAGGRAGRAGARAPAAAPAWAGSPLRRIYSGHYHLPHDVEGLFPPGAPPGSPPPPTVTYVGSPYQVSRAEEGQRKRLLVLDAERGWRVDEEVLLDVGRRFWTVRAAAAAAAAGRGGGLGGVGEGGAAGGLQAAPSLEALLGARVLRLDGGAGGDEDAQGFSAAASGGGGGGGGVLLEMPVSSSSPSPSSPSSRSSSSLLLRPGDCLRVELAPASDGDTLSSSSSSSAAALAATERLRHALCRAGVELELVSPPPARRAPPRVAGAESRAAAELLDAYADAQGLPQSVRAAARAVLEEAAGGAAAACERPPMVALALASVEVEGYGPFAAPAFYPLGGRGMRALTGRNEDDAGATSNGAGKSSLLSAVLWAFKALGGGGGGGGGSGAGGAVSAGATGAGAGAAASAAAAESARRRTAAEVVSDGCRHARVVVRGTLNGEPFVLERVAVKPRPMAAAAAAAPARRPRSPAAAAAAAAAAPPPKAGTRLTVAGEDRTLEDSRATDRLVARLFATPILARVVLLGQEELLALLDASDRAFKGALSALVDLEGWAAAKAHASRRLQAARRGSDAVGGELATMRRVASESGAALAEERGRAEAWEARRAGEVLQLSARAADAALELERAHLLPLRQAAGGLQRAARRADGRRREAEEQRLAECRAVEEGQEEQTDEGGQTDASADAAREGARAAAARARAEGEARLRPARDAALDRVARAEAALAAAAAAAGGGSLSALRGRKVAAASAPWDDGRAEGDDYDSWAQRDEEEEDDDQQRAALIAEEGARLASALSVAERAHAALEGERAAEARRRDALAASLRELLPAATPEAAAVAAAAAASRGGGGGGGGGGGRRRAMATATAMATTCGQTPENHHHSDHRHSAHSHTFSGGGSSDGAPACDRCGQPVDPAAASAAMARLEAAVEACSERCERAAGEVAELRELVAASRAAAERENAIRATRLASEASAELSLAREAAGALEREARALAEREREALQRADEAWAGAVRARAERERARRERAALAADLGRRCEALAAEAHALRSAAEAAEEAVSAAAAAAAAMVAPAAPARADEQETDDDVQAAAAVALANGVPACVAACRRAAALAADARAAANRRAAESSPHAQALEALRAQAEAHASAAAQAERASADAKGQVSVFKSVDAAFGRSGVPAFVLEGVLGELQRAAGGYLSALSDGMALELSSGGGAGAQAPSPSPSPAPALESGQANGGRAGRRVPRRRKSPSGSDSADDTDDADDSAFTAAASGARASEAIVKTVLVPAPAGAAGGAGGGGHVARTANQLSGGERKRVALALALAFAEVAAARGRFRCSALLLDEALEKLDDEGEARVLSLLGGLLRPVPGAAGAAGAGAAGGPASPLAFDTIVLADQAAAFATHALPNVDYVVKRGGRAEIELLAAAEA